MFGNFVEDARVAWRGLGRRPFPFRGATVIADAHGGTRAAIIVIDHAIGVTAPGAVVTSI
jgi:hypothetical protein